MPIVINEFEIVVDRPDTTPPRAEPPAAPPEASGPSPEDIVRVYRRHCERFERVRAS